MPWNRERNAVTLIITADYVITVVLRRTFRREIVARKAVRWKKNKRKEKVRYTTLTRFVFVTSSMDMKILSTSGWLIGRVPRRRGVFRYETTRRGAEVSWNPLYMSRVPALTTAVRHEYRCEIRSPWCIVDPGEPPMHPSISPIDGPTLTRTSLFRGPAAKFAKQSRHLLDISPRVKRSEYTRENVQYIIIMCVNVTRSHEYA